MNQTAAPTCYSAIWRQPIRHAHFRNSGPKTSFRTTAGFPIAKEFSSERHDLLRKVHGPAPTEGAGHRRQLPRTRRGHREGRGANPGEVERLLTDADKSVNDLRQDVERYQYRMALKAMVASISKLEAERCESEHPIAVADQALESAEQQHDATTTPLYAHRRQIDVTRLDASGASAELVQTRDDVDMRREVLVLDVEAPRLDEQCRHQRERAKNMEGKDRSERDWANHEAILSDAETRREIAERYRKEGVAARREWKRLEKALADVDKCRAQLEQRMRQAKATVCKGSVCPASCVARPTRRGCASAS